MAEYEFDKEQLLAAIQRDCDLFLSVYIPEQLTLEVPEFHRELWYEFLDLLDRINDPMMLTGRLHKLLGVPREHAKTTIVKLAVILFMRYSRLSFTAYISNTFPGALNAIKDIKQWLLSENEQALYGPIDERKHVEKSSESEGLFILTIAIPGRLTRKRIILKCFGVQTHLRGIVMDSKRPDLMIFDDVESQESTGTTTQQAKMDAWCFGTAIKAMSKLGVCIFIGNMLTDTSLLARLSKEKDWNPTVFGAIIRNAAGELVPLWPERWTLEALLQEYASYRRLGLGHVWEAEMMNLTSKDTLGESLTNCPRPVRPMPEEIEAGFICLDPAFGEKAWNDESALTVHVRMQGANIPIVVETWKDRVSEEKLLDEFIRLSYYWGITTWVIEAQAAQKLLIPLFRALLIQRGLTPDLFLMIPILAGKESKASRIVAFRSACAHGSYGIVESEQDLVEKLEEYAADAKVHDDLCDSAAYGTIVWSLHNTLIQGQGRQDVAGVLMGAYAGNTVGESEMNIW
jgi:hypothetical protein